MYIGEKHAETETPDMTISVIVILLVSVRNLNADHAEIQIHDTA